MSQLARSAADCTVVCLPMDAVKFSEVLKQSCADTATMRFLVNLDDLRARMATVGGQTATLPPDVVAEQLVVSTEYVLLLSAMLYVLAREQFVRIPIVPEFIWSSYSSTKLRVKSRCFLAEMCMAYARVATLCYASGTHAMNACKERKDDPAAKSAGYKTAADAFEKAAYYFATAALTIEDWKTQDIRSQDLRCDTLYAYTRLCAAAVDACRLAAVGAQGEITNAQRRLVSDEYLDVWMHLDRACFDDKELALGAMAEHQLRVAAITQHIIAKRLAVNYDPDEPCTYNSSIAMSLGSFVASYFERLDPPDYIQCAASLRAQEREKQGEYSLALSGKKVPTDEELAEEFPPAAPRTRKSPYELAIDVAKQKFTITEKQIKLAFKP